ncbi:hypothetical protein [Aquimarina algiphila]|uniref:hypothetical protein n=1 Tax=Aquimarina algiphila TaxID=2047982 RepID=UPI00232D1656|nr:hypothetical protein [Aquimarina algiphila]
MKLEFTCSQCKIQNKFVPVVSTRGQLQMQVGDEVEVECKYCNRKDKKHINRIDAVVDNKKILIVFIISMVISVVLFFMFGLIGSLVISLPILMWIQEGKSTSDFNSYKIRRK